MSISAFVKLNRIGINTELLCPFMKGQLFKIYIRPILLYGMENVYIKKTTMNLLKRTDGNLLKMTFGLPTRCRTKDLQFALNINPIKNQIDKQKLDFYERLCNNELTLKVLQQTSKLEVNKDILEEVVSIIDEYNEYPLVSSQVNTFDKIKAIKYVMDVEFKADRESSNNAQSIKQLFQCRKTNLKDELFHRLRFDINDQ